jgi:hypothetical protein
MARPGVKRRSTGIRSNDAVQDYARDVLQQTLTILVQTGHSPRDLTRMFRSLSRTLAEPERPFDPGAIPFVTGLSHIVAHWYSDPAFRGADGRPLKIPLRGRGPNLAKLIRRLFPSQDVSQVARSLVCANAVQRHGRHFAPTDRFVELTRDLSSVHVHGLMSLAGMLRTVQHNIASQDASKTNPYIPVRALPEIHRRIKREVTALLWKLDGYLRSWEVEPGTEATTHVGVGAYAYEDPLVSNGARRKGGRAHRVMRPPAPRKARRARR